MSCLKEELISDVDILMVIFGALENSIVVLVTQIQKQYCSMSAISDFSKPVSMTFQIKGYQPHEAPSFMTGSSHIFYPHSFLSSFFYHKYLIEFTKDIVTVTYVSKSSMLCHCMPTFFSNQFFHLVYAHLHLPWFKSQKWHLSSIQSCGSLVIDIMGHFICFTFPNIKFHNLL